LCITNLKLELGNKATAWSPAPEDSPNNNNVIATINQSPETIAISASKIAITGAVTLSSWIYGGTTNINGGLIQTGTITANQIAAGSITSASGVIGALDAGSITSGTLNTNVLASESITADKLYCGGTLYNVAQNKSVTASAGSQIYGGMCAQNTTTMGYWTTGTLNSYCFVDLGVLTYEIRQISFNTYFATDTRSIPSGYILDCSEDGSTWSTLTTVTNNTDCFQTFNNNFAARYIRITITAFQSGQTSCNIGNFRVLSNQGGVMISGGNIVANSITANQIAANSITGSLIAAGTITGNLIASQTITADKIVANSITSAQIASATITSNNIAANTITGANIAAGTITANNIAANTITAAQMASNSVLVGNMDSNTLSQVLNSNITIGGRNLVLNSDFSQGLSPGTVTPPTNWSFWGSGVSVWGSQGGTNYNLPRTLYIAHSTSNSGISQFVNMLPNTQYTISFSSHEEANITAIYNTIEYYDANWNNIYNYSFPYNYNAPDTVQSFTFTTPSSYTYAKLTQGATSSSSIAGLLTTLGNVKLELGNKATDWTPAPGDFCYGNTTYIDGSKIYTGSITANQIAADAITGKTITGGTINGTTINGSTINSINGNSVLTISGASIIGTTNGIRGISLSWNSLAFYDGNGSGALTGGINTSYQGSIFGISMGTVGGYLSFGKEANDGSSINDDFCINYGLNPNGNTEKFCFFGPSNFNNNLLNNVKLAKGACGFSDGSYILAGGGISEIDFLSNSSSTYLQVKEETTVSPYYYLWGVNIWASDISLKTNIQDSQVSALQTINSINHRMFNYKKSGQLQLLGYVAQELQQIEDSWVIKVPQPNGYTLMQPNENTIIPYLSKAIQEEDVKVVALEARVSSLETEVAELKNEIANLKAAS
jgi:chaperonin cofactor prefoldin